MPNDRGTATGAAAGGAKLVASIDAALDACGVRDGATLSFHHHLRNGDGVLNAVMEAAARRGLRDIHVAATSIFAVHAPLVEHIRNGVVTRLSAAFVSGPVGAAVSRGLLPTPLVLRTHGGRARALEAGELPSTSPSSPPRQRTLYGNISGRLGPGSLRRARLSDGGRRVADHVVAVTDHATAVSGSRRSTSRSTWSISWSKCRRLAIRAASSRDHPAGRGRDEPAHRRDRGAVIAGSGPAGRGLLVPDRRWRHLARHGARQ